jgi:hypothetical protein
MAAGRDEVLRSFCSLNHSLRRHSKQFNHAGKLVAFVIAWKQRVAGQQFSQNASEAPHVDGG